MRFFILATVLLLAGCTTITGNRKFESRYDEIQKGVSTRQQVTDLLGSPTQVIHPDEKSTVLIYEERKDSVENYFVGKRKVDTQRLSVFINGNDVVTDYKLDSISDDYVATGGGGSTYNTYQQSTGNTNAYHY